MSKQISWFNEQWGSNNNLAIPINDRGLNLGDGIFETILIWNGRPQLLINHLDRFRKSAYLLKMSPPPSNEWLTSLIEEAIDYASIKNENAAIRLNWSRGSAQSRGIDFPQAKLDFNKHKFWLDLNPIDPSFEAKSAIISRYEQRNANSQVSQCKIFSYSQAIQARHEAQILGYDEALLLSTNGELCCATTSNLLIKRANKWLTPRLATGCLPGIMRQQGLNKGIFQEASLNSYLEDQDELLIINSLSCHPISQLNQQLLNISSEPKELWLNLLN